jgi:hypothetical protein
MSVEATNGVVVPEFKGAETEFWDKPVLPVTGEVDKFVAEINSNGHVDMAQVVDDVPQQSIDLAKPRPNPVDYVKRQRPKPNRHQQEDPDKYLMQAKALVVQNYNEHRDPRRSPRLTMDLVYITTFSKTLNSWKAIVGSTVVRGLLWEVTFNGEKNELDEPKNEAYIDIFKRLNHVRIPLG